MLIISQGDAYENICIQFCTTFLLCFHFIQKSTLFQPPKKERYRSSFNTNCKNISLFKIFVILLSILQNLPQLKSRNNFSLYSISLRNFSTVTSFVHVTNKSVATFNSSIGGNVGAIRILESSGSFP